MQTSRLNTIIDHQYDFLLIDWFVNIHDIVVE